MKVFFKRLFRQEVPQKEWGTLKGTHHMKRLIKSEILRIKGEIQEQLAHFVKTIPFIKKMKKEVDDFQEAIIETAIAIAKDIPNLQKIQKPSQVACIIFIISRNLYEYFKSDISPEEVNKLVAVWKRLYELGQEPTWRRIEDITKIPLKEIWQHD